MTSAEMTVLILLSILLLCVALVAPKKSRNIDCEKCYLCCVRRSNNISRFVTEYADFIREAAAEVPKQAGINPAPLVRVLTGIFGGAKTIQIGAKQGELLELFLQSEARVAGLSAANVELKLVSRVSSGTVAGIVTEELASISGLVQNLTGSDIALLETHTRIIADTIRSTAQYDCADCIYRRMQGQTSSRKYFHGKQIRTLGPPGL